MEKFNINLDGYKFDDTPYKIAKDQLAEKIQNSNIDTDLNSDTTIKQFDALISEKTEASAQIADEIKKVREENFKMQMELKSLKKEEEWLSGAHLDLKEGEICIVYIFAFIRYFDVIYIFISKFIKF